MRPSQGCDVGFKSHQGRQSFAEMDNVVKVVGLKPQSSPFDSVSRHQIMRTFTEDEFDLVMQYSAEAPTYSEHEGRGVNVDKLAAYCFGRSALASWSDGKLVAGSVSSAKRMRDGGGLRINGVPYHDVRYVVTKEDNVRNYFTIGIGKPSHEGGPGYEMPIGLPERWVMDSEGQVRRED